MLTGEIPGTVDVLADLRAAGVRLVALSNWSAEMFPIARERFDFLAWFEGIVISGDVGVNKPDRRIFDHLAERFEIEPEAALFIDDSPANIDAARGLGFPRDPVHRRYGVAARTGATGAPSYPGDLIDVHRIGLIRRASTSAWGSDCSRFCLGGGRRPTRTLACELQTSHDGTSSERHSRKEHEKDAQAGVPPRTLRCPASSQRPSRT